MSKYTLSTKIFEKKVIPSLNKEVINTSVKDESGVVTDKVSIWADFPNFANLIAGSEVEGNLVTNAKGYTSLYAPKTSKTGQGGVMGAQMIQLKAQNIEHAQDRKEHSIMVSSTASMATQILVALYQRGDLKNEEWNQKWIETRYWLVKHWGNIEQPKVGGTDIDYPQDITSSSIPF